MEKMYCDVIWPCRRWIDAVVQQILPSSLLEGLSFHYVFFLLKQSRSCQWWHRNFASLHVNFSSSTSAHKSITNQYYVTQTYNLDPDLPLRRICSQNHLFISKSSITQVKDDMLEQSLFFHRAAQLCEFRIGLTWATLGEIWRNPKLLSVCQKTVRTICEH